jgi:hypothetical protein
MRQPLPPSPLSFVFTAIMAHVGYSDADGSPCDMACCRTFGEAPEETLPADLAPGPEAHRHPYRHRHGSGDGNGRRLRVHDRVNQRGRGGV